MKATIEIDLCSASPFGTSLEVREVLARASAKVVQLVCYRRPSDGDSSLSLMDSNGNTIGTVKVSRKG